MLGRYMAGPAAGIRRALEEPRARDAVERLLAVYTDGNGDPERPRGCLLVQGALACSSEAASVQEELANYRAAGEAALRERLKRARAEGELAPDVSASKIARYFWSVCLGIAVQARGGATRAELRRAARQAMQVWPVTP